MGRVGKLDKLTRSFLATSNPISKYDRFTDLQDPTYMSFKIDFFPFGGRSILNDSYSSGGLFRKPGLDSTLEMYFLDSAYEYLGNIGSPRRQAMHRAFTNELYRIQNEAPWYFQSISGLGELYKIDPAINYRGKDKVLTIDCLESVDMRMAYLADLYRNMAFDGTSMKEILPINLRTFNMNVYVLEFRRFNTTYGVIADALSKPSRTIQGSDFQKESQRRNVYKSQVGSGLFSNFTGMANQLTSLFGGVGGLLGEGSNHTQSEIESAFEAATIHVFTLQDCEFDFFSEAPPWMETVSVADNSTPAASRIKIKVGIISKESMYPFHQFIIAEHIEKSMFNKGYIEKLEPLGTPQYPVNFKAPYLESRELQDLPEDAYKTVFMAARESIYPTAAGYDSLKADSQAYLESVKDSNYLRRKPLERMLGGVLHNTTNIVNDALNEKLGKMTGGLIGETPLGNVFGRPALINRLRQGISDFMNPSDDSTSDNKNNPRR